MSFVYSYSKTMAGARSVVVDDGINIAPPARSKRDRIIEMSRRWNEAHKPIEVKKPTRRRKLRPATNIADETKEAIRFLKGHGMPEWAQEIVREVANDHGISPLVLIGSRSRRVVPVRNEVFYRLRMGASPVLGEHPSYPQIAGWFGRDHTGVLWGATKHAFAHGLERPSNIQLEALSERKRRQALAYAHAKRGLE